MIQRKYLFLQMSGKSVLSIFQEPLRITKFNNNKYKGIRIITSWKLVKIESKPSFFLILGHYMLLLAIYRLKISGERQYEVFTWFYYYSQAVTFLKYYLFIFTSETEAASSRLTNYSLNEITFIIYVYTSSTRDETNFRH
uniref:Uncharacterized protein n=1 Tax=Heterorhabditis bacteriophora TaxID=37862 RepID=A0A1I7WIY5_HETBA